MEDPQLTRYIRKVAELPGYDLFRYVDDQGKAQTVDSADVNKYIGSLGGHQFSSKDFRTWVGSRLAVELYPQARALQEVDSRKRIDTALIRLVADVLGNTAAIAKGYYIHPRILKKLENNEMPLVNPYRDSRGYTGLTAAEKLLMELIKD